MAGADSGGGAAPVQAARVIVTGSQGRWSQAGGGGGRTGGGGCLSRRLLPCALARFVEPEGVKSDRGLNGGSGKYRKCSRTGLRNNWKSLCSRDLSD
jgi:hypothetical protein